MADTETLVVMQVASGKGADSQWFDYRPSFFSDPVRIEWDKDTMFAALPADTAGYLLKSRLRPANDGSGSRGVYCAGT